MECFRPALKLELNMLQAKADSTNIVRKMFRLISKFQQGTYISPHNTINKDACILFFAQKLQNQQ